MKIRFGVGLGADSGPEHLAEIVDQLEAAGVDSLWFSELVYSPSVDPFVGMAFALARTKRLKVGTSVAVLPGRHPVLVAKQLASLCGARPRSGCCRCSACARRCPPNATCFLCPTGSGRPCSTSRCGCCASRCATIDVDFSGDFFTVREVQVLPKPTPPLDIWIGGATARGIPPHRRTRRRLAGQLPDSRPRRARRARRSSPPPRTRAAKSNPITTESTSRSATVNCPRRCWRQFVSADPISTPQSSWRPIGRRCTAGLTTTSQRA